MQLTDDQLKASAAFTSFLFDDSHKFFVISGGAGSGKSTLIKHLLDTLENTYKMVNLLKQQKQRQLSIALTATTNKAVAVLKDMKNVEPKTIHSFLKLTIKPNFTNGNSDLIKSKNCQPIHDHLIIIDEASFIDDILFDFIMELTPHCKIVLVGDQYQLAPVKQKVTIMEKLSCPKVELKEIIRNTGIIKNTGQQFKETVKTEQFQPIIPGTGNSPLMQVDGPTFRSLVDAAFLDPDYGPDTAKVLAWTNNRVIAYNGHIRQLKGYNDTYVAGETVVTIKPITTRSQHWPIDSTIIIDKVEPITKLRNIEGYFITLGNHRAFLPLRHNEAQVLLKQLAKEKKWMDYFDVKDTWLDLRPNYASTVHKAQGSTYETTFIDMSDIGKCHIPTDVARMVYVAITRASKQVVLYGNLPYKYR